MPTGRADRTRGPAAVQEAAVLLAFTKVKAVPVVCIAHITNAMGKGEGDFAKGGGLRRENRPATRRRVRKAVRGAVKQPDCPRAVVGGEGHHLRGQLLNS